MGFLCQLECSSGSEFAYCFLFHSLWNLVVTSELKMSCLGLFGYHRCSKCRCFRSVLPSSRLQRHLHMRDWWVWDGHRDKGHGGEFYSSADLWQVSCLCRNFVINLKGVFCFCFFFSKVLLPLEFWVNWLVTEWKFNFDKLRLNLIKF